MNNNDEREGYTDDIHNWQDNDESSGLGVIVWGLPVLLGLITLLIAYIVFH